MEILGKEIPLWAIIAVAVVAAIILVALLCVCRRCYKSGKHCISCSRCCYNVLCCSGCCWRRHRRDGARVATDDAVDGGGAKASKSNSLGVAYGSTGGGSSATPYAADAAAGGATGISIPSNSYGTNFAGAASGPEGLRVSGGGGSAAQGALKASPHAGAAFWRKVLRAPGFKDVARKKKAQQRSMSFQQFDLLQLTRATRNFHKKLLLGKGSTSEVYRGAGPSGARWAVKRSLWRPGGGDDDDILTFRPANRAAYAELVADFEEGAKSMAVLCHQNVIQLLGYCIEGGERVLIYEYVDGPSLESMILGNTDEWREKITFWRHDSRNARARRDLGVASEGEEEGIPFDFLHRLLIAVDIADAVAYMHTEFPRPYLHEGLHPRNILFDTSGMPKVGNVGQMKVLMTRDITGGSSMLGGLQHGPTLALPGYIDPTFHVTGKSSPPNDVYAFGVILLQIFTGRPAVIENEPGEATAKLDLGTWVARRLRAGGESSIESIVDPRLGHAYAADVIQKVLQVALDCQLFPAKKRPAMDKVAERLFAIHEELVKEGGVVVVDIPEPEPKAGEFEDVSGGEESVDEGKGKEGEEGKKIKKGKKEKKEKREKKEKKRKEKGEEAEMEQVEVEVGADNNV
ncbi:hypothetical protein CLOM_g4169 [Closterium sp. NIES-68]|nr:hypothetical protein CLOM_g4169 [Closterium sp. NIES-68]